EEVMVDPRPRTYCLTNGGMCELPSFTLYENRVAFPRAFVVPEAKPLPEREKVLAALRTTNFRDTGLLEERSAEVATPSSDSPFRSVLVTRYQPNRVVIDAGGGPGGWLVLADVWYPGWTCTIDGRPADVRRGDFLFRAVRLPEGAREVVFTFVPESYRGGRALSLVFLAGSVGLCLFALTVARYRKSKRLG